MRACCVAVVILAVALAAMGRAAAVNSPLLAKEAARCTPLQCRATAAERMVKGCKVKLPQAKVQPAKALLAKVRQIKLPPVNRAALQTPAAPALVGLAQVAPAAALKQAARKAARHNSSAMPARGNKVAVP